MVKYQGIFEAENTSQQTLTPEEAVAAIVMIAVYAEGQPSQEKNEAATNIINTMDIFENYSVDEFQEVLNKIVGILDEEGIGVLFNTAVDSISDDLVEPAFEAATEAMLVDGQIAEDKENFLYELAEALDISEDIAQDIIDELTSEEEEGFS